MSAIVVLCLLLLVVEGSSSARASRPPGWDDFDALRDAIPDYELVFSADRVNRLDVTVTRADWAVSIPKRMDQPSGRRRRRSASSPRAAGWRSSGSSRDAGATRAARGAALARAGRHRHTCGLQGSIGHLAVARRCRKPQSAALFRDRVQRDLASRSRCRSSRAKASPRAHGAAPQPPRTRRPRPTRCASRSAFRPTLIEN